jgi:hypothetical protein
MRESIAHFMWGFQPHFRNGLERAARGAFEQIGLGLGTRAFLVGFTDVPGNAFPECFEPEHDPLAEVDLSAAVVEARRRYEESDKSRTMYGSRRHHEAIHRGYLDAFRAEVIRESLSDSPHGAELTFFVGRSALVDGAYEVHPILAVPTDRWAAKPSLSRRQEDDYQLTPSFQHALIHELLAAATDDLSRSHPPEDFSLRWSDRSELIRKAARVFVHSVCVSALGGAGFCSDLTAALDELSAQPYEGRTGAGALLLASKTSPHVESVLDFVNPVPLSQTRALRKALEMSKGQYGLLTDGTGVYGLARLRSTYDTTNESVFVFTVQSRGVWELRHGEVPLLRVANTRPELPEPPLSDEHFKSVVRRLFPNGEGDPDVLWRLAEGASNSPHGTLLVVHRNARDEAERLTPQAQQVLPRELHQRLLSAVTSIDGAVLVDPAGTCHAVGVILDGHASGRGDSSRGARFNSALRYQEAQSGQCLVIIVSEDGMIDLIPNLRRQVSRSSVDEAVRQLEDSLTDDPDYEDFFRHWEHLESLAFYLSTEQCDRVNAAREALESHRSRTSLSSLNADEGLIGRISVVGWTPFAPNADMNASYFLDAE